MKKPVATSILRPFTFCQCRQASRQNGGASKSGRFRLFPRRFACRRNTPSASATSRLSGLCDSLHCQLRLPLIRTICSIRLSSHFSSSSRNADLESFSIWLIIHMTSHNICRCQGNTSCHSSAVLMLSRQMIARATSIGKREESPRIIICINPHDFVARA